METAAALTVLFQLQGKTNNGNISKENKYPIQDKKIWNFTPDLTAEGVNNTQQMKVYTIQYGRQKLTAVKQQYEILSGYYCLGHIPFWKLQIFATIVIITQRLARVNINNCTGFTNNNISKR